MVYKVNDYVSYGWTGVCKITGIQQDNSPVSSMIEDYYILRPCFQQDLTIKIPIEQENTLLRPIMTREDVLSLIASMPTKEIIFIRDERERSIILKNTLRTGSIEEKTRVIKTLYLEKQKKATENKKLNRIDEETLNAAEKQLHEEFAVALDIPPEAVLPYILEHLPPEEASPSR